MRSGSGDSRMTILFSIVSWKMTPLLEYSFFLSAWYAKHTAQLALTFIVFIDTQIGPMTKWYVRQLTTAWHVDCWCSYVIVYLYQLRYRLLHGIALIRYPEGSEMKSLSPKMVFFRPHTRTKFVSVISAFTKSYRLLAGSNHRPLVYKTSALATELKSRRMVGFRNTIYMWLLVLYTTQVNCTRCRPMTLQNNCLIRRRDWRQVIWSEHSRVSPRVDEVSPNEAEVRPK